MIDVPINVTRPSFDASVFVAANATVIGEVTLGRDVSIWYGAVVRGDMAPIRIGDGSNVQDNATIHVDPGVPVSIGRGVTIAHNAVVHGATVEDYVLIGMGAIILNGAVIGQGSRYCRRRAGARGDDRAARQPHRRRAGKSDQRTHPGATAAYSRKQRSVYHLREGAFSWTTVAGAGEQQLF